MRPWSPLLLAPLLLVGCSDGGRSAAPSPTTSPTAAPAPSASFVEPVDPLSPMPPVESAAPAPTGATCDPADVTVTDADLLADENQLQEVFALRTRGPACRLQGWPSVTLLGADDAPIRVTSRRTGKAEALALTRETSLSFVLTTPRTSDCQDVAAVLVTLPGTTRAIRTSTTMQVCRHVLDVGPVERRRDTD